MAKSSAPNPIDVNAQGFIGKPIDRVDGPLKVTGRATYAYEYKLEGRPIAYGFILGSSIAKGTIRAIDTDIAEKAPGVLLVMTAKNAPKQAPFGKPQSDEPLDRPKPFLDGQEIRYYGEPVAFVVAESFEQARTAASLVGVQYKKEPGFEGSVARSITRAYKPKNMNGHAATDTAVGNFDKGYAKSPVKLDGTYTTPYQNHNPMEPHATVAVWEGEKLTIYSAQQLPVDAQKSISKTLKIDKENLRIVCKYIGGGFGGKLQVEADAILSALAAQMLKRPVKTALTRQQEFSNSTHRGESVQRVRLGATEDGKLTAIAHDSWIQTAHFNEFGEAAGSSTRSLYAAPDRQTTHRLVPLDLPPSGSMRAPGEAMGLLALEQAMDEMAEKLNLDPIEFRLRNEPKEDPEKKIPFSTRALPQCLKEGARRFGWEKRSSKPGQMRDGNWLVGYGMAAAYRPNMIRTAQAKVTMDAQGKAIVQMAMTDIGTGSYTVMTQIAAETLQVPLEDVTVVMGDTDFPPTPGSGGSFGANSAGSALFDACMNLRTALVAAAVSAKHSPLYGLNGDTASFARGGVTIEGKQESYHSIITRVDGHRLSAKGSIGELKSYKSYSQASYGGHFVEVGVDSVTGEVRIRRMLGVFAAGRILNEKTARSQAIGGMIWGISSALHEAAIVDLRHGHFVNHDLAEYHVPVHADTANVDAVFLAEVDDKTGPLKIKGVGELGICGSGAAVANAIYNACGIRVRDYPITLDKILAQMA